MRATKDKSIILSFAKFFYQWMLSGNLYPDNKAEKSRS